MGFEGIFNFVELGRIYEMKKLDKEKLKEIQNEDLEKWEENYMIGDQIV